MRTLGRDLGREFGVMIIEQHVKTADTHPVDAMRAQAQFLGAQKKLMEEYGVPNTGFEDALAGNEDFYGRFRGIYDQYFGPLTGTTNPKPVTAAEHAPKVVSVAK